MSQVQVVIGIIYYIITKCLIIKNIYIFFSCFLTNKSFGRYLFLFINLIKLYFSKIKRTR